MYQIHQVQNSLNGQENPLWHVLAAGLLHRIVYYAGTSWNEIHKNTGACPSKGVTVPYADGIRSKWEWKPKKHILIGKGVEIWKGDK